MINLPALPTPAYKCPLGSFWPQIKKKKKPLMVAEKGKPREGHLQHLLHGSVASLQASQHFPHGHEMVATAPSITSSEQILCRNIEERGPRSTPKSLSWVKSLPEGPGRPALGPPWPKPCPVTTHSCKGGWESKYPTSPASVVGGCPGQGQELGMQEGQGSVPCL